MVQPRPASRLFDRTWRNIRSAWRDIAASARSVVPESPVSPDLPEDDLQQMREQMRDCLSAKGGEVSARARAAQLGRTYLGLNKPIYAPTAAYGHFGRKADGDLFPWEKTDLVEDLKAALAEVASVPA